MKRAYGGKGGEHQNVAPWLQAHTVCLSVRLSALTSALKVASLQSDGLEGHPRRGLHHHFLRVVQQMAEVPARHLAIKGFRRRCCGGRAVAADIDDSFCGLHRKKKLGQK